MTRDEERFTPEEVQTLTAAMAGNFPDSLAEHRPDVLRKLAKLSVADAAPSLPAGDEGREALARTLHDAAVPCTIGETKQWEDWPRGCIEREKWLKVADAALASLSSPLPGAGDAEGPFTVEICANPESDGGGRLVRIGLDGEPGRWPVGVVVINEDAVYHCLDPVKGDESQPALDDAAMREILKVLDSDLTSDQMVEAISEAVETMAERPLLEYVRAIAAPLPGDAQEEATGAA